VRKSEAAKASYSLDEALVDIERRLAGEQGARAREWLSQGDNAERLWQDMLSVLELYFNHQNPAADAAARYYLALTGEVPKQLVVDGFTYIQSPTGEVKKWAQAASNEPSQLAGSLANREIRRLLEYNYLRGVGFEQLLADRVFAEHMPGLVTPGIFFEESPAFALLKRAPEDPPAVVYTAPASYGPNVVSGLPLTARELAEWLGTEEALPLLAKAGVREIVVVPPEGLGSGVLGHFSPGLKTADALVTPGRIYVAQMPVVERAHGSQVGRLDRQDYLGPWFVYPVNGEWRVLTREEAVEALKDTIRHELAHALQAQATPGRVFEAVAVRGAAEQAVEAEAERLAKAFGRKPVETLVGISAHVTGGARPAVPGDRAADLVRQVGLLAGAADFEVTPGLGIHFGASEPTVVTRFKMPDDPGLQGRLRAGLAWVAHHIFRQKEVLLAYADEAGEDLAVIMRPTRQLTEGEMSYLAALAEKYGIAGFTFGDSLVWTASVKDWGGDAEALWRSMEAFIEEARGAGYAFKTTFQRVKTEVLDTASPTAVHSYVAGHEDFIARLEEIYGRQGERVHTALPADVVPPGGLPRIREVPAGAPEGGAPAYSRGAPAGERVYPERPGLEAEIPGAHGAISPGPGAPGAGPEPGLRSISETQGGWREAVLAVLDRLEAAVEAARQARELYNRLSGNPEIKGRTRSALQDLKIAYELLYTSADTVGRLLAGQDVAEPKYLAEALYRAATYAQKAEAIKLLRLEAAPLAGAVAELAHALRRLEGLERPAQPIAEALESARKLGQYMRAAQDEAARLKEEAARLREAIASPPPPPTQPPTAVFRPGWFDEWEPAVRKAFHAAQGRELEALGQPRAAARIALSLFEANRDRWAAELVEALRRATGSGLALPEPVMNALVAAWGRTVADATERAAQHVDHVLFNYQMTNRLDEALRLVSPFVVWQTRNIPFYLYHLAERPQLLEYINDFMNLREEDRRRRNLTARFEGMLRLGPEAGKLLGFRDALYIDPMSTFISVMGQINEPFISPDAEEAGKLLRWVSAVLGGVRLYPYIEIPLQAAGIYGVAPYGDLLPVSRLIRGVLGLDPEAWYKKLLYKVQGVRTFTGDVLMDMAVNRRIAEIVQREKLNPAEGYRAMDNPNHPLWQRAFQEEARTANWLGLIRFIVPFNLKVLSPEEARFRTAMGALASGKLPKSEERARFEQLPGLGPYLARYSSEALRELEAQQKEYYSIGRQIITRWANLGYDEKRLSPEELEALRRAQAERRKYLAEHPLLHAYQLWAREAGARGEKVSPKAFFEKIGEATEYIRQVEPSLYRRLLGLPTERPKPGENVKAEVERTADVRQKILTLEAQLDEYRSLGDPQTRALAEAYTALNRDQRAAWRRAHPQAWEAIQRLFEAQTEYRRTHPMVDEYFYWLSTRPAGADRSVEAFILSTGGQTMPKEARELVDRISRQLHEYNNIGTPQLRELSARYTALDAAGRQAFRRQYPQAYQSLRQYWEARDAYLERHPEVKAYLEWLDKRPQGAGTSVRDYVLELLKSK
jgi:hypothetical protein